MKKNREYWAERLRIQEEARNRKNVEYLKQLEKAFTIERNNIAGRIEAWYGRLAENNGVSMAEARKMLSRAELKEFKWTVEEYIKYGRENSINQQWLKELENASAKAHIDRLQALEIELRQKVERIYHEYGKSVSGLFTGQMKDLYTEASKLSGVDLAFDTKKVKSVLSKPWTSDGKTFSERIWGRKEELHRHLHTEMTRMCITGETPKRLIENLEKKFGVEKYRAKALVNTESSYFASVTQGQIYDDLDVEKYQVLAQVDDDTTEICLDLNGQVFEVKDFEPGTTAPPFHTNCRSITAPWFPDEDEQEKEDEPKVEKRNREYLVDFQKINSKDYKNKVYQITDDDNVNTTIHKSIKDILKHRTGTPYEDMFWIDGKSGEVVKKVVNASKEQSISYSTKTMRKLTAKYPNMITIHNHPSSLPPSFDDLDSNFRNGYNLGVVVTHDGRIFIYSNRLGVLTESMYSFKANKFLKQGYTEKEGILEALQEFDSEGIIVFKEVR